MRRYWFLLVTATIALAVAVAGCAAGTGGSPAASQPGSQPAAGAASGQAKVLDLAYNATNDLTDRGYAYFAEEVNKRSKGTLQIRYHPATLLTKEAEIVDAVKSGNIAMGTPVGAAASMFPEFGVFMSPYLVRSYDHAYKMLNGEIGKQMAELIENKYKVKPLFYMDFGFRHFFNTKKAITRPEDLKGMKMRVQQGKVYTDTVNGLGASAVPMGFTEMIPAIQQGVVDGADLPIVNIKNYKIYEIAKYVSITFHNYTPSMTLINPDVWKGLTADQQKLLTEVGLEAQGRMRNEAESVDSLEGAKKLLEPLGMQVNASDQDAFRKIAEQQLWPQFKQQYPDMWDKIASVK